MRAATDPSRIEIVSSLITGSRLLQGVVGTACSTRYDQTQAELREAAVAQARAAAAAIGATGLYHMRETYPGLLDGCWRGDGVRVRAIAFYR